MNNLRRLDLNQLVILHTLLREKHVSRSAIALHKSQPTISHALNQLRDIFQDPLLIREQGQYYLSSKAEALYPQLTQALKQLDQLIEQVEFKPSDCQRRFNIAMSDYGAAILTPSLIQQIRQLAPQVDLHLWQCSRKEMQSKLHEGSLDLAFGIFNYVTDGLKVQTIFSDHFISVTDSQNINSGVMSLEQWLQYPHVLVSMKPYEANEIDRCLAQLDCYRRIAISLPYWQLSPQILHKTDLILTVASRILTSPLPSSLSAFPPPLVLPNLHFQMLWHQRADSDPALLWLKQCFTQLLV